MKLIVTETQIKELLNQVIKQELDEQDLADADASDAIPKSGASDTQSGGDGYPDNTTKWEDIRSPISRGAGNQVGPPKKWTEAPNTQPTRGVDNQLT